MDSLACDLCLGAVLALVYLFVYSLCTWALEKATKRWAWRTGKNLDEQSIVREQEREGSDRDE